MKSRFDLQKDNKITAEYETSHCLLPSHYPTSCRRMQRKFALKKLNWRVGTGSDYQNLESSP
jgi:hypothetical protein